MQGNVNDREWRVAYKQLLLTSYLVVATIQTLLQVIRTN